MTMIVIDTETLEAAITRSLLKTLEFYKFHKLGQFTINHKLDADRIGRNIRRDLMDDSEFPKRYVTDRNFTQTCKGCHLSSAAYTPAGYCYPCRAKLEPEGVMATSRAVEEFEAQKEEHENYRLDTGRSIEDVLR